MKKRILFVEDNPLLLEMYAMVMDSERDKWEVVTMGDARQALATLDQCAFDVIVSDMRMPGMDGIEFLGEVRRRLPGCSRIIISGLSDQAEVVRSLNSTHQFLAKPVDVKMLRDTLARISGLDAFLQEQKLRALVGQVGALPSFPSLYLEVMQAMRTEEPSIETVGNIIAKDPAMTAKMLQLVNSVASGLARKVGSPVEAVQFLGINTVRSLVLSTHIFACFEHATLKGLSISQLWKHAMRTGLLARTIMQLEQAGETEAEDANVAGVLHDMGKLMLAESLPEQFQQALALVAERGLSSEQAELEVFGATHAGVAAYLLGLWGLPAAIVEAVAFHHIPSRSPTHAFGLLAAVHTANSLEHELSREPVADLAAGLDADYLRSIGVQDRLPAWRREAAKLVL